MILGGVEGMDLVIQLVISGAIGGFSKSLVEQNGRIVLPGREKGTKYVHLGFLANVLLGAIVAFYMATNSVTAFTSGIAAAFVIEKFIEKTPLTNSIADGKQSENAPAVK